MKICNNRDNAMSNGTIYAFTILTVLEMINSAKAGRNDSQNLT